MADFAAKKTRLKHWRQTVPRLLIFGLPLIVLAGIAWFTLHGDGAPRVSVQADSSPLPRATVGRLPVDKASFSAILRDASIRPDLRTITDEERKSQPRRQRFAVRSLSAPASSAKIHALRGGKPTPQVRAEKTAGAQTAAVPQIVPDAPSSDGILILKSRYKALITSLKTRGILEEDLPAALRQKMAMVQKHLEQKETSATKSSLEELERDIMSLKIDRTLVEAKLQRVDRFLGSARGKPEDVQALRDQASIALQEFMDGRYNSANRHLNRILHSQK